MQHRFESDVFCSFALNLSLGIKETKYFATLESLFWKGNHNKHIAKAVV